MIKRFRNWVRKAFQSSPKEDEQAYFVGIDLGTTKTAVCFRSLADPKNSFFLQFGKHWKLPSVVAVRKPPANDQTKKRLLVSKVGDNLEFDYMLRDSKAVAQFGIFRRAKLSIGGKFSEPDYPSELIKRFSDLQPEHIIARILVEVRNEFKKSKPKTQPNIHKATITIPASWSPEQRRATKMAAKMAGFTNVFLLEEPVAALIKCIDLEEFPNHMGNVVIIDFGGGTCDVAGVEVNGNEFTLLGATGQNRLGGEIIDDILFEDFVDKMRKIAVADDSKTSIIQTIEVDHRVRGYVHSQIEKIKVALNERLEGFAVSNEEQRKKSNDLALGVDMDSNIEKYQPEKRSNKSYKAEINIGGSVGFLEYEIFYQDFIDLLSKPRKELREADSQHPKSVIEAFDSLLEWFRDKYLFDKDGNKKVIQKVYSVGGSSKLFFVSQRIEEAFKDFFDPDISEEARIYEDSDREQAIAEGAADFEYQRSIGDIKFHSKLFYNLELGESSPIVLLKEGQAIESKGFEQKPTKTYELDNQIILPVEKDIIFSYSRRSRKSESFSGERITKRIRHNLPLKPNAPINIGYRVSADGIVKILAVDPTGLDSFSIPEKYPLEIEEGIERKIDDYKELF